MIQIRRSKERGFFDHGWLRTHHTFSFADYFDPKFTGFRSLRVINEDFVEAGKGFGTHPHRDMEIITYILEGAVEHKDSMGNGSIIQPGDVQRMSAGTGVTHSEFNPLKDQALHLLQIWILPEKKSIPPSYEQKSLNPDDKLNRLCLAASGKNAHSYVKINQDVDLYIANLESGKSVKHALSSSRFAWVQVARGSVIVNQAPLEEGDGAAVSAEENLFITAKDNSEILLFDLA